MPDGVDRDQAMRRLMATGERTSHLATQLLTLARVESAGTTAVRQDIDLNMLCESVAHDVVSIAIEREIDFALETCETPVVIVGDPTLLGELIRNLLDNAFKYTPKGGGVVLAVHGSPASIAVEDSGPGVDESDYERIFAPFARVARIDRDIGAAVGGTGLGLAIVREVAQAHSATVGIERSRMGGASFVVRFA